MVIKIYEIQAKKSRNGSQYAPSTKQGALPVSEHGFPKSKISVTQQSKASKVGRAMVEQPTPPHRPHAATQQTSPLGESIPFKPLLHIKTSIETKIHDVMNQERRQTGELSVRKRQRRTKHRGVVCMYLLSPSFQTEIDCLFTMIIINIIVVFARRFSPISQMLGKRKHLRR